MSALRAGVPTSVVITGIDSMKVLEQALEAARTFLPPTQEHRRELLAKTREAASRGHFEPFKTSTIFDGTAANPQWLGEERERLRNLVA